MKIRIIQNLVLFSLYAIFPVTGSEYNGLPREEALQARKMSLASKARALFCYVTNGIWPNRSQHSSLLGRNGRDTTIVECTLPCEGLIHVLRADTVVPIEVRQGPCNLVILRAPRFLMEQLSEKYNNGVLTLATNGSCVIIGNVEMVYQIQTTRPECLYQIKHEGTAHLILPMIGSHDTDTEVEVCGIGNVTFQEDIRGKNITIRQTSMGGLRVNGSIEASEGCSLGVNGSGNMSGRNITSQAALSITVSSIGSMTIDDVTSTHATLSLSVKGSGNLKTRQCSAKDKATITQSSIGGLTLAALYAQSLTFIQSGSGNMSAKSLTCNGTIALNKKGIGAAKVTGAVSCHNLIIKQSGIGNTNCAGVGIDTVKIDNSSIGSVTLSGSCKDGTVTNSGSGNCNLKQLQTAAPLKTKNGSIGRVSTQ